MDEEADLVLLAVEVDASSIGDEVVNVVVHMAIVSGWFHVTVDITVGAEVAREAVGELCPFGHWRLRCGMHIPMSSLACQMKNHVPGAFFLCQMAYAGELLHMCQPWCWVLQAIICRGSESGHDRDMLWMVCKCYGYY
jgi:hypothetical protein